MSMLHHKVSERVIKTRMSYLVHLPIRMIAREQCERSTLPSPVKLAHTRPRTIHNHQNNYFGYPQWTFELLHSNIL